MYIVHPLHVGSSAQRNLICRFRTICPSGEEFLWLYGQCRFTLRLCLAAQRHSPCGIPHSHTLPQMGGLPDKLEIDFQNHSLPLLSETTLPRSQIALFQCCRPCASHGASGRTIMTAAERTRPTQSCSFRAFFNALREVCPVVVRYFTEMIFSTMDDRPFSGIQAPQRSRRHHSARPSRESVELAAPRPDAPQSRGRLGRPFLRATPNAARVRPRRPAPQAGSRTSHRKSVTWFGLPPLRTTFSQKKGR